MKMPQLFVPEIGTELTLVEDWTFSLYPERRNSKMMDRFGDYRPLWMRRLKDEIILTPEEYDRWFAYSKEVNEKYHHLYGTNWREYQEKIDEAHDMFLKTLGELKYFLTVTIPKDVVLKVDRIYIRKGISDYSSITFYAQYPGEKKKVRFWAKLADCNKIVFK